MSEITIKPLEAISEAQMEAQQLHARIVSSGNLAASAMVEMCRDLKKMRDAKLYRQLGYETFETYVEQAVGLKQRQAYSYISTYEKLGSTVLQSNATLGITKLELLTQVPPTERAAFMEQNKVGELSARELKAAMAKLNEAEEQLSMLQEENQSLKEQVDAREKNSEAEELKAKLTELEEKLKQASSSTEPDPDLIDKQVKKALREAERKNVAEIAALKKEKEEAAKAAREQAVREANEKIERLMAEKQETEDRLANAVRQAKMNNADPKLIEINFVFQDLQSTANNLAALIEQYGQKEQEQAQKLKRAMAGILTHLKSRLESGV